MVTFGSIVRAARREDGLSQEVLAERAGTTKATVSRVEGEQRHADESTARKLVDALELDPCYLALARLEAAASRAGMTVAELRASLDTANIAFAEYKRLGLTGVAVFDAEQNFVSEHASYIEADQLADTIPGARLISPANPNLDPEIVAYLREKAAQSPA